MKKVFLLILPLFLVVIVSGCIGQSTQNNVAPSAADKVEIKNFAFSPQEITVSKGTTVTWTNTDDIQHTVTSDNGKFESGLLSKGQTFTFTFNEPGTYEYHCTPHPYMKAKIIVTE